MKTFLKSEVNRNGQDKEFKQDIIVNRNGNCIIHIIIIAWFLAININIHKKMTCLRKLLIVILKLLHFISLEM